MTFSFGIIVVIMDSQLLIQTKFSFSWARLNLLSLLSGLNKVISGGGYGPVAKTSLPVSGNKVRSYVGVTLFSVIFINITAFVIYLFARGSTFIWSYQFSSRWAF